MVTTQILGDGKALREASSLLGFKDGEASGDGLGLEGLVVGSEYSEGKLRLHEVGHQVHQLRRIVFGQEKFLEGVRGGTTYHFH